MTGAAAQPAEPVDVALALGRVLGDRTLLARVLARFRDEYHGAAGAIRAAHGAGELEEARRLAHTLKGAAAMIAAHALQREALALEVLLRERSNDTAAQLARLESELGRVMRALDALLDAGKGWRDSQVSG